MQQGFQGCIKSFRLNSERVNLAGTETTNQHVTHCYSLIETGAYFAGDAYAVYGT